jgi:hypothetical protein
MPEARRTVFQFEYSHSLKPKPNTHQRKNRSSQKPGFAGGRYTAAIALQAHQRSGDEYDGERNEDIADIHMSFHFL